ncbi:MAG: GNAT family N-acetyltransferase [Cyanobacteria bacterium J06573_11]
MTFLACLPLIEADIPAVLALDQRCLGGLWTTSGYQRELESDCSDLCVLVSAATAQPLQQRLHQSRNQAQTQAKKDTDVQLDVQLAARDSTQAPIAQALKAPIKLLGIGCLWAILEEAHITTLAIEPAYQGHKLGLLLLTHLLNCGRNRGLTRATLEVRVSNHTALNLYQKFDFAEAGQRKRYYADGESARILWRSGLQTEACLKQINQHRQSAIAHLAQQNYTIISDISGN